jgi:hypothetical protein
MSNTNQKNDLKSRIKLMEKEILNLEGKERTQARIEYHRLLTMYSKECGFEEPIYMIRA